MRRIPLRYRPLAAFAFWFAVGGLVFWGIFALVAGAWNGAPLLLVGVCALIMGTLGLAGYDRSLRAPAPRAPRSTADWSWLSLAISTYVCCDLLAQSVLFMRSLALRWAIAAAVGACSWALVRWERRGQPEAALPVASGTSAPRRGRLWKIKLALALVQLALTTIVAGSLLRPCSWLDIPRRLQGCVAAYSVAEPIGAVAYSPTGTIMATTLRSGKVQLLALPARTLLRTLGDASDNTSALAFSPDGLLVAAGNWAEPLQLWRVADGAPVWDSAEAPANVGSIAFSPDGRLLASLGSGILRVVAVADGHEVFARGNIGAEVVRFMPDNRTVVVGAGSENVMFLDTADGALLRQWHMPGNPSALTLSGDGALLATGDDDGILRVWRVADQTLLHTLHTELDGVDHLVVSPDSALLAVAGYGRDDGVQIWQLADGSVRTLADFRYSPDGLAFAPDGLAFAPDGQTLAVASYRQLAFWRTR